MTSEYNCLELEEYYIVIEDENNVVYAYLLKFNEIVGDVWLCNRGDSPIANEWETGMEMPFKNSTKYIKAEIIEVVDIENLEVLWTIEGDVLVKSSVYQNGILIAILKDGFKPGYSINVKEDGPLALTIQN